MFVQIKENNYDKNGNHLYRVYIYKPMQDGEMGQYKSINREEATVLHFGRVNNDNSITTQDTKDYIMSVLRGVYGNKLQFVFC